MSVQGPEEQGQDRFVVIDIDGMPALARVATENKDGSLTCRIGARRTVRTFQPGEYRTQVPVNIHSRIGFKAGDQEQICLVTGLVQTRLSSEVFIQVAFRGQAQLVSLNQVSSVDCLAIKPGIDIKISQQLRQRLTKPGQQPKALTAAIHDGWLSAK